MNPVRASMAYVYVLQSGKNGRLYTGCATDLRKRLKEHQMGRGVYTKNHGPYELIYYKACKSTEDAYMREKYLKSGMGRRYLKNRLKRFLALPG